jgi:hypothetical protein
MKKLSQRDNKTNIQNALNSKIQLIDKMLNEKLIQMQKTIDQKNLSTEQKQQQLGILVSNISDAINKHIRDASGQITVTIPSPKMASNSDKLKGGKGDDVPYSKMNKKQLELGTKIEMEHTDDPEIAKEIAGDHLAEQVDEGKSKKEQNYYSLLEKIDPHNENNVNDKPAFWRKNLDYVPKG